MKKRGSKETTGELMPGGDGRACACSVMWVGGRVYICMCVCACQQPGEGRTERERKHR